MGGEHGARTSPPLACYSSFRGSRVAARVDGCELPATPDGSPGPPRPLHQAVEANIVDIINRFPLEPSALKLPKVRALSGKKPRAAAGADATNNKAAATTAMEKSSGARVEAFPVNEIMAEATASLAEIKKKAA